MSNRDRALLDAAGLSITDASALFHRSKQALYQGLSNPRDYFSADDAAAVLRNAKRSDSARLEGLLKFIAENYSSSESKLILPEQIGYDQLEKVLDEAEFAIVVYNGNPDHLIAGATFAKVLISLLEKERPTVGLVAPGLWVLGSLEHNLGIRLPRIFNADENVSYLPSFLIASREGGSRAFFFGRTSVEEVPVSDARRLWEHFQPRFEEKFGDKVREAG